MNKATKQRLVRLEEGTSKARVRLAGCTCRVPPPVRPPVSAAELMQIAQRVRAAHPNGVSDEDAAMVVRRLYAQRLDDLADDGHEPTCRLFEVYREAATRPITSA